MEKRQPSHNIEGNVSWYSCCGKQEHDTVNQLYFSTFFFFKELKLVELEGTFKISYLIPVVLQMKNLRSNKVIGYF